ncbi:ABC transporter ATP-binding protein [Agrococcus lahaulensis]|uniref:iron ABC transporter ATP-binding protein n=1 Tax=Agrococcus lahaulensis TaxID=341722 RepID=UPI00047BCC1E|nr:ATP-binding cassette domain-containing protein [Agrococcus lahaulensis]
MIAIEQVSKRYAEHVVLGPVSSEVPAGGITALVGPNGAGKSTLLSVIGRLLDPSAGSVRVMGHDVQATKSADLARIVSILRQENRLEARLTVRELVAFGRFPWSGGRLTFGDQQHIDRAIRFLHLEDLADRQLDALSGGQRQRAFVAMVLAQDTEVVLLDEPLASLDPKHAVAMMRELRAAADDLGRTIVIVLHDLNMAAAFADRILALKDGQICVEGTVDEVMQDAVLERVFDTPVRVHRIDDRPFAVFTP